MLACRRREEGREGMRASRIFGTLPCHSPANFLICCGLLCPFPCLPAFFCFSACLPAHGYFYLAALPFPKAGLPLPLPAGCRWFFCSASIPYPTTFCQFRSAVPTFSQPPPPCMCRYVQRRAPVTCAAVITCRTPVHIYNFTPRIAPFILHSCLEQLPAVSPPTSRTFRYAICAGDNFPAAGYLLTFYRYIAKENCRSTTWMDFF